MSVAFVAHPVAKAAPAQRAAFIRSIYLHLALALLAFLVIEAVVVQLGILDMFRETGLGQIAESRRPRLRLRLGSSRIGLMALIVAFMAVPALIADSWGKSALPQALHYAGLAVYLVIDALVLAPALLMLVWIGSPQVLPAVALMTVFLMLGALAVVWLTDSDYAPVTIIFCLSGSVMLGMVATAMVLGASAGMLLFGLMQFYAVGALVVRTSQLMDEIEPQHYAGAALSLFASMPLLLPMFFIYVIQIAVPGVRAVSQVNGEFSARHAQQDYSHKEEASRRREKEMPEYVERQMARGRKA